MSEENKKTEKAPETAKFYKYCTKCCKPNRRFIPYCDNCLTKMKHKTQEDKDAAKERNSEIVEAYHGTVNVTKCPECDKELWSRFQFCPYCGKATQSRRNKINFIIIAVFAVVLVISCIVGVKIAKKNAFEKGCEQMKITVIQICQSYGLEVESVDFTHVYTSKDTGSKLYYINVVSKSKSSIEYKDISACLKEINKLRFDDYLLDGKHLSSGNLYINGVRYDLDYDGTLERNGSYVYGRKESETTTEDWRLSENRTSKKSYATTKYRTTTSQYNIKDYGHADDFYDEYWDDFDNYEDAEDYYDEFG